LDLFFFFYFALKMRWWLGFIMPLVMVNALVVVSPPELEGNVASPIFNRFVGPQTIPDIIAPAAYVANLDQLSGVAGCIVFIDLDTSYVGHIHDEVHKIRRAQDNGAVAAVMIYSSDKIAG
jgi:hypothetical protein